MPVEEDPPAGAPEWVVTYGDMMSLLLTFFIMLVSMSELKKDEGKYRAMLDALKQTFGPEFGISGAPGPSLQKTSLYSKLSSLGDKKSGGLLKNNEDTGGPGGKHRTVEKIRDGLRVTLGGPVQFAPFSAELTPPLKSTLDIILQTIRVSGHDIEIRGHSSPQPLPVDSPYADQFDLSFARAQTVANYLQEQGIPPERMRVSAAGDTEPRTISTDQTANRRVDVFLRESYIDPPAVPGAK